MIKYQKKFHIYAFLIHILHLSLLPNNKKSFLHPSSNKISKKISYLRLLNSYLTLLTPSNNKNHFYTLLVIKYQKKCHIYTFLIHISCLLLLSNNKKIKEI